MPCRLASGRRRETCSGLSARQAHGYRPHCWVEPILWKRKVQHK
ncbi:hypothetical protein D8I24_7318 [Cupriavidus necator H850]|nr:hypothetical protein D8I24_7318 [Cupriavidus necator H850]